MRRLVLIGLVIVALSAVLGACAKKEDSSTRLVVTAFATTDYDPVRRALYKEFESLHPGVTVDYRPVQAMEYYNKLNLQFLTGTAPDAVFVENVYFPQFVRPGFFVPLDTYIENDPEFDLSIYHDVGLKMYQFEGKQYCLPGNMAVFVLFYNVDMFDAEGIGYPDENWDWGKLLEVAQRLTKRDSEGRIIRFGMAFPPHYSLFLLQNEAPVYTEDYSRCIINNPAAREAIEFCAGLADKHHVAPDMGQMAGYQTVDIFQIGKAAMQITGRWQVLPYRKIRDFEWDVAPLPRGKRRATLLGSHGWGISKNCKNPALAWEFIKFITGPAGAKRVVDMGDCNPAIKTLDDYFINEATLEWPREKNDNKIYLEAISYAYTEPFLHPWVPALQIADEFQKNIEEWRYGRKTLERALEDFQHTVNRLIEEKRPKSESGG